MARLIRLARGRDRRFRLHQLRCFASISRPEDHRYARKCGQKLFTTLAWSPKADHNSLSTAPQRHQGQGSHQEHLQPNESRPRQTHHREETGKSAATTPTPGRQRRQPRHSLPATASRRPFLTIGSRGLSSVAPDRQTRWVFTQRDVPCPPLGAGSMPSARVPAPPRPQWLVVARYVRPRRARDRRCRSRCPQRVR